MDIYSKKVKRFVINTIYDLEKFIKTKILSKELNEAINRYASISMEESKERLKHFQKNFAEINIIEI